MADNHDPKHLQRIVQDVLIPHNPDLSFKPMFGGIMAFAYGHAFVSLSNVGLAIKLPPEAQTELLAVPGTAHLRYEPNTPPSKSYILVPVAWLTDTESLLPWLLRSAEYVKTLPAKKRKST